MVFYFTAPATELLRSLLFFIIVAPQKQTGSQRSKTHFLYSEDIKSTMWQITVIIEKRVEDFKIILIF